MDLELLEKRIRALEDAVGISHLAGEVKPVPQQIEDIQKRLKTVGGAHQLLKIPVGKLQKLNEFALQADTSQVPLNERLEIVADSEEIVKQRVDLLQEFQENFEKVIEDEGDAIANLDSYTETLTKTVGEIKVLSEKWRKENAELEEFKSNYNTIIRAMVKRIDGLQSKIAATEVA
ncbi:unnamed protein product [Caenorhabditis auriculariae]|uniref:Uncharacterized protein n=1 Tax=Caenorhabditis auriculariae TaxID=2777116 RepID=A0A8S1HFS5_9PELO|nr:unnamed protein product [Caenorhabditis auriculariae]